MKRILAIAMAAGFALSASAEILERFEFNDSVQTWRNWNSIANTGSTGTKLKYGPVAAAGVDGAGNLLVSGALTEYSSPSDAFSTGALTGPGTYSFEMKVTDWNIDTGTGNSALNWRLWADGSMKAQVSFIMDGANGKVTFASAGSNYRTYTVGGLTGGATTARLDFDVTTSAVEYFIDGVSKEAFAGVNMSGINKIHMAKQGDWATAGTSSFNVDELNLSVIPEPATLGLVAMVGGGLLFIRRRFMI